MQSVKTMFNVVIVFSKTLDPTSDLTQELFNRFQPLMCAVVSAQFKLSTKNVATEIAKQINIRQHFLQIIAYMGSGFDNLRLKYNRLLYSKPYG